MSAEKETVTMKTSEDKSSSNTNSNKALLIDQVRTELESYFAPQNIQNDFNLRQKMTSDGYIDIDWLLELKLISDLASNRDILISAISKSKLLKMNSGCTMVKYMPLLERNVLILRDMPKSTKKEEILTIFDNSECCVPSEVHSDHSPVKDRNNWFCSFKTEEECLKTAKYLQQFGRYNDEKLHVRVKAIHDVKKADASPSMKASIPSSSSNKKSKIETPAMPYSAGGYYANYAAYFGGSSSAMDPYFGAPVSSSSGAKGKNKEESEVVIEDRTAISDYPGKFDKYSQETFLKIYASMKAESDDSLLIPQSMRGRDFRIVCEDVLVPIVIASENEQKEKQKKSKKKKRRKNNNRRRREVSGTYYEDDMYGNEAYYDEYDQGNGYYDDYYYEQDENAYYDESGYYAAQPSSPQRNGGSTNRRRNRGQRGRGRGSGQQSPSQRGRGSGRRMDGARKYNSRRNGQVKNASSSSKAKKTKTNNKSKQNKVRNVSVWKQKGVKSEEEQQPKANKKPSKPKVKKYATSKGVYARKEVIAN